MRSSSLLSTSDAPQDFKGTVIETAIFMHACSSAEYVISMRGYAFSCKAALERNHFILDYWRVLECFFCCKL
jgi:hypothetical protein